MTKADYDIVDSSKKQMKRTQDTILSVLGLFFGRIDTALIRFRDLATFNASLDFGGPITFFRCPYRQV